MTRKIQKNNKTNSVFVVAEIGNTHEGSLGLAKHFIMAAADCGCDAVKFQTHIFEAESLPDAPNPPYFFEESRKDYFERTAFNTEQYKELVLFSEQDCGVEFISSPFSLAAVNLLEEVGVKRYKIASGEVTNSPLLKKIAQTGKPVIMSSGMSSWQELDKAVDVLKKNGCNDLTVMQCSSVYPCPPEKTGLNVIKELQGRYKTEVGFSDHTLGISSSIAAVVLGAKVIEKHFTLSHKMYGSDAKHSLEPAELKKFVEEVRDVSAAMGGSIDKDSFVQELREMKMIFEKSIVSSREIPCGTQITEDCLCYKKPGDGISASRYEEIIGEITNGVISKNTVIRMDMLR